MPKRPRNVTAENKACPICGFLPKNALGLASHLTSCRLKEAEKDADALIETTFDRRTKRGK